ncbi:hypothetical protein SAY86_027545 [Trapa natans]|uniref:Sphingomyelin phosphodiesterase 4 n=1 Tax=Trapa natans TaxID=22666 RepID=A0AAN7KML2_TRANT|nr:hypothetical protein SAY86_027545 [Trapa natans]
MNQHRSHSCSLSQSLSSFILSASSPSQISSASAAVESFLRSHSPSSDHTRHFFSIAFPSLICKIFGFDDYQPPAASSPPFAPAADAVNHGWIDTVISTNDSDLASRVFAFLSPGSTLMNSILAVDRLSLVRYGFPTERLPEWIRSVPLNEGDSNVLAEICPLFRSKVREDSTKGSLCQVQLNVFEYFMFWFAYYPMCRANNENKDMNTSKKSKRFRLENWANSFTCISSVKRGNDRIKAECNLYIRLLYSYLRAFVPIDDLTAHQPYCSSLLHYPVEYDGSVLAKAQFLVGALINYWLLDNDFSPVPINVCKSFGVSFSFCSVLRETSPTSGLGEVVKLFVKYLNLSLAKGGNRVKAAVDIGWSPRWNGDSPVLRNYAVSGLPCSSTESWNTWVKRPLYRFILRTFLFCPIKTTMKNASQVFSVWLSYIEPWKISLDEFSELEGNIGGSAKSEGKEDSHSWVGGYSMFWQDYVLYNYLFYSSLVMHFIGFAHKFLHTDPEMIVQMVTKIMCILTSSQELTDIIKNVYALLHSKESGINKVFLNNLYPYIPSIREQFEDWEYGLCESNAHGTLLHENWNNGFCLFSDGEDGGKHLLQLFILRAEAELQAASRDSLGQNLQLLDTLKNKINQLFGGNFPEPVNVGPTVAEPQNSRDDIFMPRRIGKQTLASVQYRGDWMKRPVSDDEIAWLVKLLVPLSDWINQGIGLDWAATPEDGSKPLYVDVIADMASVSGLVDTVKMVLWVIASWLLVVSLGLLKLMRSHGVRVNLRILASKKIVMVILMAFLFAALRRSTSEFLGG